MSPNDFLDVSACCALAGGSRPIHKATWHRHVRSGTMPRPVKVGALSRWLRSEVEASLASMIEGRAARRILQPKPPSLLRLRRHLRRRRSLSFIRSPTNSHCWKGPSSTLLLIASGTPA